MSRLGKKPIAVPAKVNVSISGRKVSVSSGSNTLEMEHRPEVKVAFDDDAKAVCVTIDEKDMGNRQARAYWGMTRSLIANMVEGVTEGYTVALEVVGVGFTAEHQGNKLALKVGFANTITKTIPPGLEVAVERNQYIRIKGIDKQLVGQFAAEIRAVRPPEPYNGKGIKYAGEVVKRKQGKAFGA